MISDGGCGEEIRNMKAGMIVYVAAAIKTEIEVEHNLPMSLPPIKLKWAPGQIGAIPVFKTRETAEAWANGTCEILAARVGNAEGEEARSAATD